MELPIMVHLCNRRAIVVGGGSAAKRKIAALRKAKARVIVIAPKVAEEIEQWVNDGHIRWWPRRFSKEDCHCATLVVAATDVKSINSMVIRAARSCGALAIACDGRKRSTSFCATLRRGWLTLAAHTGGTAPALSVHLKERLSTFFGPEWERVGPIFGRLRKRIKALGLVEGQELTLWRAILASGALEALLAGDDSSYNEEVERCISSL